MDGLIFGFMDNIVVLIGAYVGFIQVEKHFGNGRIGGILGATISNTISDAIGTYLDPTMEGYLLGIVIGCLIPICLIPITELIYNKFKNGNNKGGITQQWKLKKQKSYYSGPIERSMF